MLTVAVTMAMAVVVVVVVAAVAVVVVLVVMVRCVGAVRSPTHRQAKYELSALATANKDSVTLKPATTSPIQSMITPPREGMITFPRFCNAN